MAIVCAYCGGEHDAPAQVRQCWNDGGRVDVTDSRPDLADAGDPGSNDRDHAGRLERSSSTARPLVAPAGKAVPTGTRRAGSTGAFAVTRGAGVARSGPDALGRAVLIAPGQSVPEPWTGAPVLRIDADTLRRPGEALATLRGARHTATRLVIELDADFGDDPLTSTTTPPFELGPRFAFDLDELHHLVWSNAVDARDPDRWVWLALDVALGGGARELPPTSEAREGDVMLPDGTAVWLDGGPVRFVAPIEGVPVVHRIAVEHHGRRVPAGNASTADLAADQLAAVTHPGGAARIIAPAGSGKTRVLTERARHLLTQLAAAAIDAVSLVAFNKRAQEEMRERTTDLPGLQVRTLNAIALAIVNGTAPFARPGPHVAHDRRARRSPDPRRPGVSSPRSATPTRWRRGSRRSARCASVCVTRAGRGRTTAATSMGWPMSGRVSGSRSNGRAPSTSTIRSTAPSRCSLSQPEARARRPAGVPRAARRRVPGSHPCPPAPRAAARGAGRRCVRRRRRRPDDLRLQRRRSGVADRLRRVLPRRRRPSARGQLPLPGRFRRGRRSPAAAQPPPCRQDDPCRPDGSGRTAPSTVRRRRRQRDGPMSQRGHRGWCRTEPRWPCWPRVNALLAPVQVALASAGVADEGGVGTEFARPDGGAGVLAWLRLAAAGRHGPMRSRRTTSARRCVGRRVRSTHASTSG